MRLLGSVIVILLLIVGADIWINHKLQSTADGLVEQIDQLSLQIKENQWQNAVEQTAEFEQEWKQKAEWWPMYIEHQEMDNIEFSLARFKEYVASEDDALSLGQLSEIRTMIEHIPRKEDIDLGNIF